MARPQTSSSSPRGAGNLPESSFFYRSRPLFSLSLFFFFCSFHSPSFSPFSRQASVPRDRRNPLPSFRNDDMKRVLMWVQLWSSIPIKTLFLLLLPSFILFYRFLPFLRRALFSGFSVSNLAFSFFLFFVPFILIPHVTFVR